jgi:CTP:molybdopterin cytidylyltransferase MocA
VEYSFVQNADSPRVQLSTLNKLIEHREFADFVYPECLSQKGHPVLINKATLEYLVKCPSCAILKEVLWKNKGLKVEVDDKSVTMDIDTPEDYKQFLVSGR